jgi:hypothetical protein
VSRGAILAEAFRRVRHDRWLWGAVRRGRLEVLGHSGAAPAGSARLTPLARRALFEGRPLAVCSLIDEVAPGPGRDADWELSWPALIYAPVARPRARPAGLLIVGCRRLHWYSDEEVELVAAAAAGLVCLVAGRRASRPAGPQRGSGPNR